MALAETAELSVRLTLRDDLTRGLRGVETRLGNLQTLSDRSYRIGQQIGTGIRNGARVAAVGVGVLASQVALGLNSLVKLEQATAQTNAVIKSTGGVAGVTARQVGELAEKYESLNATIGDETIREAENLLLTFTNVRKEAFEPTLAAILDMNTALGRDEGGLQQTVLQVGKALQDPVKGITALRRAGVNFTKDQQDQIKALVESGKAMEAQKLILAELNKEFGGSFIAQGGTTAGKVAKFTDSIEDLQRALATALLPTVGRVADKLSEFLADPKVIRTAEELGEKIAGLFSDENLKAGGDILKEVFNVAREAAPVIASAAKVMGGVVSTAVNLFRSLPPEIQQLAIGAAAINKLTGGLVTNLAGGLISSVLKQLVSGVVNVQGGVVNVTGAGVPGTGPVVPGKGPGGLLGKGLGLLGGGTIVVVAAAIASEFEEEIQGLSTDIRKEVGKAVGVTLPTVSPKDLQWPFGPKNTPTILPQIFGGNGLLGGTGGAKNATPGKMPDFSQPIVKKLGDTNSEVAGVRSAVAAAKAQTIAAERGEGAAIRAAAAANTAATNAAVNRASSILAGIPPAVQQSGARTQSGVARVASIAAGIPPAVQRSGANLSSKMGGIVGAVKSIRPAVNVKVNAATYLNARKVATALGTYRTNTGVYYN